MTSLPAAQLPAHWAGRSVCATPRTSEEVDLNVHGHAGTCARNSPHIGGGRSECARTCRHMCAQLPAHRGRPAPLARAVRSPCAAPERHPPRVAQTVGGPHLRRFGGPRARRHRRPAGPGRICPPNPAGETPNRTSVRALSRSRRTLQVFPGKNRKPGFPDQDHRRIRQ